VQVTYFILATQQAVQLTHHVADAAAAVDAAVDGTHCNWIVGQGQARHHLPLCSMMKYHHHLQHVHRVTSALL